MPIPDKTIFGPHLTENRPVEFGEVRQLVNDELKLEYLKKRLEQFLVNQINPISDRDKANSPFPLTVLTCIAVETLGRVVFPISKYEKDSKKKREISKLVSVQIYGMFDKTLNRQLTKDFKILMKKNWPDDNIKDISSYAELFHSYLRTSFVHGYRAKNVFLNAELETGWTFHEGSLVINPYWFWEQYKKVFNECFDKIFDTKENNNSYRMNALIYFDRLINE
jgi:hypothetical protein